MGLRGKHTKIWVGGYALTAKTREVNPISVSFDEIEESAYGQDHSTLKGQGDTTIGLNGYFSKATGEFHDAVSSITDSAVLVSLALGENATPAAGDITLSFSSQQTTYQVNPDLKDVIAASGTFRAKGGVIGEFGILLADETITSDDNSTGIDQGAQTTNGAVAYLHITAVSASDTVVVTVEDSSDDVSYGTLGTFTIDGSAVAAERIEIAGTVEQYVRVAWDVTGTGVSFDIAVMFVRK